MANSSVPGGDTPVGTGHRRVYRSTPGAPSPASWSAKFGQLARTVYIGLRDGGLAPETTFDLACFLMDWGPSSPAVRELAEQSVAGTDPVRLADLAGQVLEESGFQPGFDTEPRLLARLEDALEAVKADMRATGLAGPVGLAFVDDTAKPCGGATAAVAATSSQKTLAPREAAAWRRGGLRSTTVTDAAPARRSN